MAKTQIVTILNTPVDWVTKTPVIQRGIQLCPEIRMDSPHITFDGNKFISTFPILEFVIHSPFGFSNSKDHRSKNGWTLNKVIATFEDDFRKRLFSDHFQDTLLHNANIASKFILTDFALQIDNELKIACVTATIAIS